MVNIIIVPFENISGPKRFKSVVNIIVNIECGSDFLRVCERTNIYIYIYIHIYLNILTDKQLIGTK